jgi:CRP-like cAMP-binding protein
MMRTLATEPALANAVCAQLMARNLHYMQDLVELRTNSCEKRLARILLRLAGVDASDSPETAIPKLDQAMLAEMVGTTRSRISFFLNGFRDLGFIDYRSKCNEVQVRPSLFDFYSDRLLTPEPAIV